MSFSPEERGAIASQISEMRAYERKLRYDPDEGDNPVAWDRDFLDYIGILGGLSSFLKYARNLREDAVILDLGAGTTRAVSEISRSKIGEGLRFEATALSFRPEIKDNLGLDKTHITTVEMLRGVKDNSVSAIFAVKSLAYSSTPHLAVERIDRVLIPGGAIKAAFKLKSKEDGDDSVGERNYQPHDYFSRCFEDLGYDVAVSSSQEVILAIKPGTSVDKTAQDLLRQDSKMIDLLMRVDEHY